MRIYEPDIFIWKFIWLLLFLCWKIIASSMSWPLQKNFIYLYFHAKTINFHLKMDFYLFLLCGLNEEKKGFHCFRRKLIEIDFLYFRCFWRWYSRWIWTFNLYCAKLIYWRDCMYRRQNFKVEWFVVKFPLWLLLKLNLHKILKNSNILKMFHKKHVKVFFGYNSFELSASFQNLFQKLSSIFKKLFFTRTILLLKKINQNTDTWINIEQTSMINKYGSATRKAKEAKRSQKSFSIYFCTKKKEMCVRSKKPLEILDWKS